MYLPTRDAANGLFDHYLAVSPPSAGTTCYHHRCAALTGRQHRCKVKREEGKKKKRQPGDEPERCWRSNPSPRRHNHHDQLGGQSTGLLFYIRTAISLGACEPRRVFIPVLEGMFAECGRKPAEKRAIKGRKHMQKQRVQGKQVAPSWFA